MKALILEILRQNSDTASKGGVVASIGATIFGYLTFSNVAFTIGIISGICSILASLSTMRKNKIKDKDNK